MGCTAQSAFYRQLFIVKFSGTYNQEHVTTDVLREGKEDVNVSNAHHLRAVIYPQPMLLLFFLCCPGNICSLPCFISNYTVVRMALKELSTISELFFGFFFSLAGCLIEDRHGLFQFRFRYNIRVKDPVTIIMCSSDCITGDFSSQKRTYWFSSGTTNIRGYVDAQ